MLIDTAMKIFDPSKFPGDLVFLLEGKLGCGVFSGKYDGFESPEEMNQLMPEVPVEGGWEDTDFRFFKVEAPARLEPGHRKGYHYVIVESVNRVYVSYLKSTEFQLEHQKKEWTLYIWGICLKLSDYQPGSQKEKASALERVGGDFL